MPLVAWTIHGVQDYSKGPVCNLLSVPFHRFQGKQMGPFHMESRRATQNCVGDAEHLLIKPRLSE